MQNNTPKTNTNIITKLKDITIKNTKWKLHSLFVAISITSSTATFEISNNIFKNNVLYNHQKKVTNISNSLHIWIDHQINNNIFKDNFLYAMRIYQEYFVEKNNPKMWQLHLEKLVQATKDRINEISILKISWKETYNTSWNTIDRSNNNYIKTIEQLWKNDIYIHNLEINDSFNIHPGITLVHTHYFWKLYNKDDKFSWYLHIRFQFPRLTTFIQEYLKNYSNSIHWIYVYNENDERIINTYLSEEQLNNYERVRNITSYKIKYITYHIQILENEIATFIQEHIWTTEAIFNEISLFLKRRDNDLWNIQIKTEIINRIDMKAKSLVDKAKNLSEKVNSLSEIVKSLADKDKNLYEKVNSLSEIDKDKSKIKENRKKIQNIVEKMKDSLISLSSYFDHIDKFENKLIKKHIHNSIKDEKGNRYLLTFQHPIFYGEEYHIDIFSDLNKILEYEKTSYPIYITVSSHSNLARGKIGA